MRLVSLGRAARSKAGIKVRQPLSRAYVKVTSNSEEEATRRLEAQILDELNVKELAFVSNASDFVEYQVRPNAVLLGPKYGGALRQIEEALRKLDSASVAAAITDGSPVVAGDWRLEPPELQVLTDDKEGYRTAMEAGYAVTVPTQIDAELLDEGLAREIVHRLQTMRRNAGFDIADRIITYYQGDDAVRRVMTNFGSYMRQETLSVDIVAEAPPAAAHVEKHTVDGQAVTLGVVQS
jgi:isoleucyl-tRNA synthetase